MPVRLGRRRLPTAGLALLVVVLVILVRGIRVARQGDNPTVIVGLAVVAGVAVVLLAAYAIAVRIRIRRQVAHVATLRPGAELVASRATDQHTAQARRLGVGTRNLPPDGKGLEYVVAAILPDRVELWVRGDDRPRWVVARRPGGTTAGQTRNRWRTHDTLTVSGATAELLIVPVGESFGQAARRRAFERAARALGI